MAHKNTSTSRKQPVSQKRVAIVLASLVGTLTLSAGALLLMEGGLGGSPALAVAYERPTVRAMIAPATPIPQGQWRHIIIYESNDPTANAATLIQGTVAGNVNPSRYAAPFHFVVGSSMGRPRALDGELEVGASWKNQQVGIPHAGWPDVRYNAIPIQMRDRVVGVCLAADIARKAPSDAQFRTLLHLVHELQQQLQIPSQNIHFQWEISPNDATATEAQRAFAKDFRSAL